MNAAAIAAIALSAVMLSSIGVIPAHSQIVEPISISTDKETYAAGETVTVNGEIRKRIQGAITFQVYAPNGNRINANQTTLGDDGSFMFTFTAGGPQWREAGTYTLKVSYGPNQETAVRAEATIEFGGAAPTEPTPSSPEPTSPIDAMLAGITFDIVGGDVISIAPGANSEASIEVTISATDDGTLTIGIPRSILDSRTEGQTGADVPYTVTVDGEIANAEEDASPEMRTLVINFFASDTPQVIEIIGSFIIPEFGALVMVVLAVAIVSIVAITSRSRLSILPRY